MGYYAHSWENDFLIRLDRIAPMIADIQSHYDSDTRIAKTTDLFEIFIEFGLTIEQNDNFDIDNIYFEYQKFHSDDIEEFFSVIAQYVEQGSYITFLGEDDCLWAYYFDGLTWTDHKGQITFPGMSMDGPKRTSKEG